MEVERPESEERLSGNAKETVGSSVTELYEEKDEIEEFLPDLVWEGSTGIEVQPEVLVLVTFEDGFSRYFSLKEE